MTDQDGHNLTSKDLKDEGGYMVSVQFVRKGDYLLKEIEGIFPPRIGDTVYLDSVPYQVEKVEHFFHLKKQKVRVHLN